jgi:signal transduction histidine kinase
VLTNLLGNALKYGPDQPIELSVYERAGQAFVQVRDHGIGIEPAAQARVFERFERAVSERLYGGLGLGLWVSREIVHAHGGEISLVSEPGVGTTFTVALPLVPA